MRSWTKTAGLLFLASAAVYDGQAIVVAADNLVMPGAKATPLRLADANNSAETAPVSTAPTPTVVPTTSPTTHPAEPRNEGRSVARDEVRVGETGTVELHVNDANLVEVLRMLSLEARVNILPSKEVRGTVTANLYDVTIREALDAILKANGFTYREKGNVVYVYSLKEAKEIADAERQQSTEVFHLYYTPATNALAMIKPVLSDKGVAAVSSPSVSGIDSSSKDAGGNSHATEDMIVVTDFSENLDKIRKVIKDIDRRPQQIMVEATIMSATLNDNNALGVDFNLLGGVNFSNITSSAGQLTGVSTGATASSSSSSTSSNPGDIKPNGSVTSGGGTGNNFTQGINGLRLGVVTNNVSVFVSALEEATNATVLANPKVLVLNKQKGEVKVARQDPFRGKTLVNQNGLSQQDVEFLETGTLLIFRPYIGDDGYIRMEVHPEDSTPLASSAADLPPTKLTTETTTNVMIKDGYTIVIGGMFRETAQSSKSQIPFLGNLPWAGPLFRKQQDTTSREEVIILLTVHVIKDMDALSKLSATEAREAEKLRVGVRHGMMPWGRERLAETAYEEATKEMNKPNPNLQKVLWHLNCATNLNPLFSEAIDLKAKVTGKEVTSVDNSSIRTFLQREIMAENAASTKAAALDAMQEAKAPALKAPAARVIDPVAVIDDGEAARAAQYEQELAAVESVASALAVAPATQPAHSAGGNAQVIITSLPSEDSVEGKPSSNQK